MGGENEKNIYVQISDGFCVSYRFQHFHRFLLAINEYIFISRDTRGSGTWRVTKAQTERLLKEVISGYDPLTDLTEQHLQIAIEKASGELCQEGVIDLEQQGDINSYFLGVLIPPKGDPFGNIQVSGWTDPATGSPVQSYDSTRDAALLPTIVSGISCQPFRVQTLTEPPLT